MNCRIFDVELYAVSAYRYFVLNSMLGQNSADDANRNNHDVTQRLTVVFDLQ